MAEECGDVQVRAQEPPCHREGRDAGTPVGRDTAGTRAPPPPRDSATAMVTTVTVTTATARRGRGGPCPHSRPPTSGQGLEGLQGVPAEDGGVLQPGGDGGHVPQAAAAGGQDGPRGAGGGPVVAAHLQVWREGTTDLKQPPWQRDGGDRPLRGVPCTSRPRPSSGSSGPIPRHPPPRFNTTPAPTASHNGPGGPGEPKPPGGGSPKPRALPALPPGASSSSTLPTSPPPFSAMAGGISLASASPRPLPGSPA